MSKVFIEACNKIKILNDNRHNKSYEDLYIILNSQEYNEIIKKCLNSIHDTITKNKLWKEKNIQVSYIFVIFINTYLLENKGVTNFEWYSIKEQKLLLVIKELLESFNNIINMYLIKKESNNEIIELLPTYVNYLYEYIELYNKWESKYKYRMSRYYLNIFKYIINIYFNINTSEIKKKYLLVKANSIYKNIKNTCIKDIIKKFNSKNELNFFKEVQNIEKTDFINLIVTSDLKTYHEICINQNYKLPFDKYDYNIEIDIPTKIDKIEENMKETPPYFGWLLYYLQSIKNTIEINNIIPISIKNIILELINEKNIIDKIEIELSYKLEDCKNFFTEMINNIIINLLSIFKYDEIEIINNKIKNINKSDELSHNIIHLYIIVKYLEIESKNKNLIFLTKNKIINLEKEFFDENYKKIIRTSKWIKFELEQSNLELLNNISKNTNNIHNIFISELIIKYTVHCGNHLPMPETLILDLEKIFELSQQFKKYLLISQNIYYINECLEKMNINDDIINQIEDLLIKQLLYININDIKTSDIYKIVTSIIGNKNEKLITDNINKSFMDTELKKIITEQIFTSWAVIIKEISVHIFLKECLIKLIPEIQKSGIILKEIININIKVHGIRYTKILIEESIKLL
jgi:hypothetical protein